MSYPGHPRIGIDPEICFGKARIEGTRMRVCDILDMLGAGMTEDEILNEFGFITRDDIRASLNFASVILERHMSSAFAIAAE